MEIIKELLGIGYLAGLSAVDIRSRQIPLPALAAGGVVAVLYQVFWGETPIVLCVAGVTVGIVFLGVSKLTGEAFGYGDSLLILILGIYLGVWNLFCLLSVSFLLAAGFAMVVLVLKKFRKKSGFPFVPFLAAGYLLVLLLGGF